MAGQAAQYTDSNLYPLSYGQEALWFLYNLSPAHCAYNINLAWRIKGKLDKAFLKKALQAIVDNHHSLRTIFVGGSRGEVRQQVRPEMELDFQQVDGSGWSREYLHEMIAGETYRPFDLTKGPVSRWRLFCSGKAEYVLLFSIHHIATDYGSIVMMMEELSAMLAEHRIIAAGAGTDDFPYGEFVLAQREKLSGKYEEKLFRFWQKQLQGKVEPLNLPTDSPRPRELDYRGDQLTLPVPSDLAGTLRHVARREGVGLNVLYLAAYTLLLHRYCRQDHILVSVPVTSRTLKHRNVSGYFINPVVLALDFDREQDGPSLIRQVQQRLFHAILHKDYPFARLVSAFATTRRSDLAPVSQAMFNWLDFDSFTKNRRLIEVTGEGGIEWHIGEMVWQQYDLRGQTDDFDVVLEICHGRESDVVHLQYNENLFARPTVEKMADHYLTLLSAMVEMTEVPVSRLPLIRPEERRRILSDWSNCRRPMPEYAGMHRRFEDRARQQPGALALIDGREELTYAEVNRLANQVAGALSQCGSGPGTLVGVCLKRSARTVICLLGILKSGAAYVPLDPDYPPEHLAFMAEDAGISLVLAENSSRQSVPPRVPEVFFVDERWPEILRQECANPNREVRAEDLAYVIYTSGSSGRPKGVAIEHGGVSALIDSYGRVFSELERAYVGAVTSLNFDISVMDIFATLGLGGTLILAADPMALGELPARERIRLLVAAPSTVASLLKIGAIPRSVTTIGLGGDLVRQSLVDELYGLGHIERVYNMYGPTEETVWATYALILPQAQGVPHIGRPIAKTEVYILDRFLQPVPAGVPGELCLGGPGVARGYLNRPELTAERFVPHPFAGKIDGKARLYRTGDLARFRHDGNIEFLGRIDAQVKVRGFRIEPGEIETVLQQHPEVAEAVVVVREDRHGEKFLQACVVAKEHGQLHEEGVKVFLRERLPGHMVPSVITTVDELPVGPSGKIDRRALPEPQHQPKRRAGQAPAGGEGTVGLIARIWQEELGWEGFGLDENFFDIGGHSLMMVAVFSRLKELLVDRLLLTDLYTYPTVRSLADFLDSRGRGSEKEDALTGCPAQKRNSRNTADHRVAIIGMACRFAGAADKDRFWENLKGGIESIGDFSDGELAAEGVPSTLRDHRHFVKRSGRLDGIDLFDAEFFGISPREAEMMDPQHRLLLECAWHALEDAGIDPERTEVPIGVYGGCGFNAYLAGRHGPGQGADRFNLLLGNSGDFLSSRIGYKLNLKGPTVNVQTACSTSMTALHMAVNGLLQGDCDIALAGGVSLGDLQQGYLYREGMILSAEGRCRPFDEMADGTVPGQGVGMVVLRRLTEAVNSGHHIYSTILGTAVNSDGGGKAGFTAPSAAGQAAVIAAAQARAGIGPAAVSYVEAHGTGTKVGDPIEVAALARVFGAGGGEKSCALGSVKANIGHPDAASGIAGIIKTALALRHRTLPPQINFAHPNKEITFAGTPFFISTGLRPWTTAGLPRRAGVSSFGLGGCNGHAVLEEPPEKPETGAEPAGWQLLPFSAPCPDAVAKIVENLASHLQNHPGASLQDVAYTLQRGRKMFSYRQFIVADSVPSAIEQLVNFAGTGEAGHHPTSPQASLLIDLGRKWQAREDVDWSKLHDRRPGLLPLPGYPFRRQHHWIERPTGEQCEQPAGDEVATAHSNLIVTKGRGAKTEPDETERIIAGFWEEYLGIGEYRSDDDFFDSGGDSLLAVMMLERLRTRFDLELSGDVLIGRSTLGQLAEYIRQLLGQRLEVAESGGPEYAIRLKTGLSSCPPLFLCHPGAGHLYFYLDLIKYLDIPGAVYGIEAMGLRPNEQPLPSIEAIAGHHLQQIRLIQGRGPYWLGGSSFGGMVAYEVAQQLLAMGEEVEFLYMVDTPGPGHMVGPVESNARILATLFAEVLGVDSAHLTEKLLILESNPEKQIEYIVQKVHSLGQGRKIPAHFGQHFVSMVKTHVTAMRNYQPKPYSGFLLFFRPSEATADYSVHAEMAWLPLAVKGTNVYTVPGNHLTMNMEPNVWSITAHLQRYLTDNTRSLTGRCR